MQNGDEERLYKWKGSSYNQYIENIFQVFYYSQEVILKIFIINSDELVI